MDVAIPLCDRFFDAGCTGTQHMEVKRSETTGSRFFGQREHPNVLSAYIDGGLIYGLTANQANSLRTFQNGKLDLPGNLLPRDGQGNFVAGDPRVNENIALTTLHTIFAREHNRLCDRIASETGFGALNDEEIYQIARHYVIGLLQKITFDEFLPQALGTAAFNRIIGAYRGYNANVNPNIVSEFSTAAYRFGHVMINAPFRLINAFRQVTRTLQFGEMFFNPRLVNEETIAGVMRGALMTQAKERNIRISEDLRSFLIPGPQERNTRQDLFVFNLQRGRDHGLGGVNDYRAAYNMLPAGDFNQVFGEPAIANALRTLYGEVNLLDLSICVTGERAAADGVLGDLGGRIVGEQFRKIRDGDRFWYEGAYPAEIVSEIKSTTLLDLVQRNTDVSGFTGTSFFSQ